MSFPQDTENHDFGLRIEEVPYQISRTSNDIDVSIQENKLGAFFEDYYAIATHQDLHFYDIQRSGIYAQQKIFKDSMPAFTVPFAAILDDVSLYANWSVIFQIHTFKKTLYLRVGSSEACNSWINFINSMRIRYFRQLKSKDHYQRFMIIRSIMPPSKDHSVVRTVEEISVFIKRMKENFKTAEFAIPDLNDGDISSKWNRSLCNCMMEYLESADKEAKGMALDFISNIEKTYFEENTYELDEHDRSETNENQETILLDCDEIVSIFKEHDFGTQAEKSIEEAPLNSFITPDFPVLLKARKWIMISDIDRNFYKTSRIKVFGTSEESRPGEELIAMIDTHNRIRTLVTSDDSPYFATVSFIPMNPDDSPFFATVSFIPMNPYAKIDHNPNTSPIEDLSGDCVNKVLGYLQIQVWGVYGMAYHPEGLPVQGTFKIAPLLNVQSEEMTIYTNRDGVILERLISLSRRVLCENYETTLLSVFVSHSNVAVYDIQTRQMVNWIDLKTRMGTVGIERLQYAWNSMTGHKNENDFTFPMITFHPDRKRTILQIGSPLIGVIFWDFISSEILWHIGRPSNTMTGRFAKCPDGSNVYLLANATDGPIHKIKVYDVGTRKRVFKLRIQEPTIWDEVKEKELSFALKIRQNTLLQFHPSDNQLLVLTCHGKVLLWQFDEDSPESNVFSPSGLFNEMKKLDLLHSYAIAPIFEQGSNVSRNDERKMNRLRNTNHSRISNPEETLKDPLSRSGFEKSRDFISGRFPDLRKSMASLDKLKTVSFAENSSNIIALQCFGVKYAGFNKDGKYIWTWAPGEGKYSIFKSSTGELVEEIKLMHSELLFHLTKNPALIETETTLSVLFYGQGKITIRKIFDTNEENQTIKQNFESNSPKADIIYYSSNNEISQLDSTPFIVDYINSKLRILNDTLTVAECRFKLIQAIFDDDVKAFKKVFDSLPTMDVNFTCLHTKHTPLVTACLLGRLKMVELLIFHGASTSVCSSHSNYLPIHAACMSGNSKLVKLLLDMPDCSANTVWNILPTDAQQFLSAYPVENLPTFLYPLHIAAFNGNMDVLSILIQKGCNFNLLDSNEKTPLHYACSNFDAHRSIQTIETLIVNNVNVNQISSSFSTALHEAVFSDNCGRVIMLLLKAGANADIRDIYCDTPIDINPEAFIGKEYQSYLSRSSVEFLEYEMNNKFIQ
ncbi:hypothetical protein O9G_004444 [Rozella allomycis CSF55]|uniref:Uncharacterized protein n=1 Tax=Rozella allomycis (strain CSF55) TaxID=988480 RepID=A0A075AYQ9_ROZAC|nr:hypothetical protein O9G_004444 [Rozella allomycis CSF55]|eukprot:EPZ33852.1 hypothetical protein O9G_004444 [Rozella allomycis CSF55]